MAEKNDSTAKDTRAEELPSEGVTPRKMCPFKFEMAARHMGQDAQLIAQLKMMPGPESHAQARRVFCSLTLCEQELCEFWTWRPVQGCAYKNLAINLDRILEPQSRAGR